MKKIHYNKLIRDKIPEKIIKKGSTLKTRKLSQKEFIIELLKKLVEESQEIVNSKNKEELTREIGDTLDIIEEIKKVYKISNADIKRAQRESFKIKGGFKKRLFLLWSSDDGYKKK